MQYSEGAIGIPRAACGQPTIVHYEILSTGEPDQRCINGGLVLEVTLRIDGAVVCDYDCGWNIYPRHRAAEVALEILLDQHKPTEGRNEDVHPS